jgi:SWI/SNF-related matrix-associated actin-dependent regulator of chromatin subfamily A-like protein 1
MEALRNGVAFLAWSEERDSFIITVEGEALQASLRDALADIPGGRWNRKGQYGEVPASTVTISSVIDLVSRFSLDFNEVTKQVMFHLNDEAQTNYLLSFRKDGMDLNFSLRRDLHPYQAIGAEMALRHGRVLICDEPGLGKTMQGIAVLSELAEESAIIICPKSVKGNWVREMLAWMFCVTPSDICVIRGSKPHKLPDVRFHIINHELVPWWIGPLMELNRSTFIVDEVHKVSNGRSQRGRAVNLLTNYVMWNGVPVAREDPVTWVGLSGTPVANHPQELIHPLRIMGVLDQFGGEAYIRRTCCVVPKTTAAKMRRDHHLIKLNESLRKAGVYRRMIKAEVAPWLPAKTRLAVPIEIDNWREYTRAEADFKAWAERMNAFHRGGIDEWARLVAQHKLLDFDIEDPSILAKYKDFPILTQGMAKINTLRQISFLGKLSQMKEWVDDFLASGEKLVVFAWFRKNQAALKSLFPRESTVSIFRDQSERQRDEAVDRFQSDPKTNLMVASIVAGGEGITLTKASNVVLAETGWTPAQMEQPEDRVHRLTQTLPVTCWYLVGAGTIEERIFRLIDAKLKVISRVVNGRDITEMPVINPLISELLETS